MCVFDKIVPVPYQSKLLEGEAILLGKPGVNLCRVVETLDGSEPLIASAKQLLNDCFSAILNAVPGENGAVEITLAIGEAPEGLVNAEQGYSIKAADNSIAVTGFGAAGLYYGVVTLCQMLAMENNVLALPALEILDRPDLRTRGHMIECRYGSNLMTLRDWKKVVDDMAAVKMNQIAVAVYGCWNVQYDNRVSEYLYVPIKKYPQLKTPVVKRYYSAAQKRWIDEECLPPMFEEDFFGELIAYGKTRGVEVLPLVNSYGHNTLIPATFPEISAKDENGEPQLTGFCTHNEKTYEVLFTVYDEIIDRYLKPNGIESFHIGLDEVRGGNAQNAGDIFKTRTDFCQCPLCKDIPKDKLYLEHALRLMKYLKSKGMKNIYIYHDMLRKCKDEHGNDATGAMERILRENDLQNEVIIDWWTYADIPERLNYHTTQPEQGLRRTVKPMNGYYHWNVLSHTMRNVQMLLKIAHDEHCEGLQSYSAWDESFDRTNMTQANYSWNFKGTGDVAQASDRYIKARFGTQFAKAKRAFQLFDWIMEMRKTSPEESEDPAISNYDFMMNTLGYYVYSYVRPGLPYPRNFPGEAMQKLLDKRMTYERALYSIASMAYEAEACWNEVAQDPVADKRMARRFAYDAAVYRCLVEDYIALLQMHDLAEDGLNGCTVKAVRKLAAERKDARLSLMARLEENKEAYLIPSHQRNHTIFMQLFADLEGYLATTKPENITLDFTDLSHFASETFWKLR